MNLSDTSIEKFLPNIGKRVTKAPISGKKKHEPKPFKSGFKINTVKSVIIHPQLLIPAYTFEEDNSHVECRRCVVVE
jgi:hypothetical protein